MRKKLLLPVLVLPLVWMVSGNALAAETFYRYETEKSIAYTDKLENVPERYRESAVPVLAEDLFSYSRTTIAENHPPTPRPGRLDAIDASQAPPRAAAAPARQPIVVYDQTGVTVMADGEDPDNEGPVRVERNVYRWEEGSLYQYTVVRRGERVLAEIREGNGIF